MVNELAFAIVIIAFAFAGIYIVFWTRKQERKQTNKQ
jgi:cbb3-type cytochrome oxidase subunit 3